MKFSTSKLLAMSLVLGLAMAGCNKQEPSAPKQDDNQAQNTVKTEANKQANNNAPVCDDVAAKNSLVRALSVAVNDEVLGLMDSYKNADKLDLARRTQQQLGQINLDLQNIRADGDGCLADVVAVVPASDLSYAERHYKASGKPSLAELGNQQSVQMSDGRIVTPVRYSVQDGKVVLADTPSALAFIANVVSASAYMTAQGAGQVDIDARPAVNVGASPRMDTVRPQPILREPELPAPSQDFSPSDNTNNSSATNELASDVKPEPKPAPVEGDGELVIVESDETY